MKKYLPSCLAFLGLMLIILLLKQVYFYDLDQCTTLSACLYYTLYKYDSSDPSIFYLLVHGLIPFVMYVLALKEYEKQAEHPSIYLVRYKSRSNFYLKLNLEIYKILGILSLILFLIYGGYCFIMHPTITFDFINVISFIILYGVLLVLGLKLVLLLIEMTKSYFVSIFSIYMIYFIGQLLPMLSSIVHLVLPLNLVTAKISWIGLIIDLLLIISIEIVLKKKMEYKDLV